MEVKGETPKEGPGDTAVSWWTEVAHYFKRLSVKCSVPLNIANRDSFINETTLVTLLSFDSGKMSPMRVDLVFDWLTRPVPPVVPLKTATTALRSLKLPVDNSQVGTVRLKDYQLSGVSFLAFHAGQGRGSILADEQGLGPEMQVLGALGLYFASAGNFGPALIVCRLTTIMDWIRRIQTQLPNLFLVPYHGTKKEREEMLDKIQPDEHSRGGLKCHILLTTYEILFADQLVLRNRSWSVMVMSDVNYVRTRTSGLYEALVSINASVQRIGVTSQPLQHGVDELHTLLALVDPMTFGNENSEKWQDIGNLQNFAHVQALHNLLRPFLLRRLEADVLGAPQTK